MSRARVGRARSTTATIVAATLTPPPKKYGVTHWSSRLLGRHLGIGNGTVAKAWRDYGVAPWRVETFKFSTDPELVGEGHRRRRALPGAAGERDRAVRRREVPDPGAGPDRADAADAARPARAAHPRLQAATAPRRCSRRWRSRPARSPAPCKPRHRHQEFLAFLKQVARAYPDDGTGRAAPGDGQLRRPQDASRSATGSPRTRGSTSTSPRPPGPGSTWSRSGSGSSNARPSTAAPSAPSRTSTPRSAPSSTAGTTAATPSSGPRPPTRSSRRPTVRPLQTRTTSWLHKTWGGINRAAPCRRLPPGGGVRAARVRGWALGTCASRRWLDIARPADGSSPSLGREFARPRNQMSVIPSGRVISSMRSVQPS